VICPKCGADLSAQSETALALARYQANDRVMLVYVVTNFDCCPACAAAAGAYPKDQVPVLPTDGCSHPLGCRCFYQPKLSEVYP
jgi:hypothetical protein